MRVRVKTIGTLRKLYADEMAEIRETWNTNHPQAERLIGLTLDYYSNNLCGKTFEVSNTEITSLVCIKFAPDMEFMLRRNMVMITS